jgi:hypothetical protein
MWKCVKCREEVGDDFDVCWQCGTSREGVEDPDFRNADEFRNVKEVPPERVTEPVAAADGRQEEPGKDPILCPRCRRKLDYVGTKSFHEGTRWGILGDLGELFVNKERFDVYCCPRCGRVEFFVDGIGEQFRPH